MREHLRTALGKQITLENGTVYSYIVTQVEVANALGTVVAVLDEFQITDQSGNLYKLHKTKEGNWYDLHDEQSSLQQSLLQRLKRTIDHVLQSV